MSADPLEEVSSGIRAAKLRERADNPQITTAKDFEYSQRICLVVACRVHSIVGLVLESILPAVWLSVQVFNSNNKYFRFSDLVDDSIWKTAHLTPPCPL